MAIPFLGDIFKGAAAIIGQFVQDPQAKSDAHAKLVELQLQANAQALDYETTLIQEQSANVRAEVGGQGIKSWWRPVVMLTFAALIVTHWLGLTDDNLTETQVLQLFDIVKLGLGGYVIGRSAEKIVATYKNGSK